MENPKRCEVCSRPMPKHWHETAGCSRACGLVLRKRRADLEVDPLAGLDPAGVAGLVEWAGHLVESLYALAETGASLEIGADDGPRGEDFPTAVVLDRRGVRIETVDTLTERVRLALAAAKGGA